jgi:hypothetical protein
MNGYVQFETADGEPIGVNADRVNFVRRFRGGDDCSAINFEKGNFVIVSGNIDTVMKALAQG